MNNGMLRRSDVRRAAAQSSSACSLRGISGNSIWRPERNVQNARSLRGNRGTSGARDLFHQRMLGEQEAVVGDDGDPFLHEPSGDLCGFPLERTSTVTSPHGRRETTS